jgi:hypothetical protein
MSYLKSFMLAILAIFTLTQCGFVDDSESENGGVLANNCAEVGKSGYKIFCQAMYNSQFFVGKDGLLPIAKYFLVDDANLKTFLATNQLTEEAFLRSPEKTNRFIDAHSAKSDLTGAVLTLNSGRTVSISGVPENLTIDGLKATVTSIDNRLFKLQGILPVALP